METIGKLLKQRREEKNLTIEAAAQNSKIQPHIIMSIENGNCIDIGGKSYERMMCMTYAQTLGFTESEIKEIFKIEENKHKTICKQENASCELFPSKVMFNKNTLLTILLVIVIIILTITAISIHRNNKIEAPFRINNSSETIPQTEEETIVEENEINEDEVILIQDTVDYVSADSVASETNAFLYDRTDYLSSLLQISTINPLNDDASLVRKFVVGD